MTENENEDIDNETWDSTVKGKVRLFVLYYCTDDECIFNQSEAYRKAYTKKDKKTGKVIEPNAQTCQSNGSRLMKKSKVKLAVQRLLKTAQADIDEEMVYRLLKEMCLGATFNPADVLDKNGKLAAKTLKDLGDNAKLIAQIEPTKFGTKYTLIDRTKYMTMLGKYLNLVRPETQVDIKLPVIELTAKYSDDENQSAVDKWNKAAASEE